MESYSNNNHIKFDCLIYQNKFSYKFNRFINDLEDLKLKIIKDLDLNISTSLLFLYENKEDCDLNKEESFDINKKYDKIYIKVLPCENIYKSLLPPLGLPSRPLSRPSINFRHSPAELEIKMFKCLKDQTTQTIYSNIWSLLSLSRETNLSFSTEYEIGNYVISVLQDVIFSGDRDIKCKCIRDIKISGLEPDIWITSNKSGLPIGVLQFKKPFYSIIEHHRIHGEIFDYMIKLKEMYGVINVFGIVSTYEKWRVYWLPDTDGIANSEYIREKIESNTEIQFPKEIPYETNKILNEEVVNKYPFQQRQFQKQEFFNQKQFQQQKFQQNQNEQQFMHKQFPQQQFQQQMMNDPNESQQKQKFNQLQFQKQSPPQLLQHSKLVENDKFKQSTMKRLVYGTEAMDFTSKELPLTLLSVVKKMYYSEKKSKVPLLDNNRKYIQLVRDCWYWVDIKIDSLKYIIDIDFDKISAVIVLLDLGGGAHGRAWLCCSIDGYVFVLKFSEDSYTELDKESSNWKKFWNFNSKVETWNDRSSLMIPYLSPATEDDWKDEEFVTKVSHTITKLAVNGLFHQDLRKRHVGKYIDINRMLKVAFFDLSLCEENRNDTKHIEMIMRNSLFENISNLDIY